MIRYGQERRLDLSSFLPGYVADEELSEVVGVFQDVLNEMYEGAEAYTKTREIGISRDSYLAGKTDPTYCISMVTANFLLQ